ncbi:MAG: hypothetical protein KKE91_04240 [Candidatus Omnitrophica bacterium]|nr:hypothetical protein [Candidatus Omnitrophota bacterium]
MPLRPSLKNVEKPALLFNLALFSIIISLSLSACSCPIEPTYKEEDIPSAVKQICKDEYNLEVINKRTPTTLWIYIPLSKILDKDYGIVENKIFDQELTDKLRKILNAVSRVLISSDHTPEFFVLLSSDITMGLDYTIAGCVEDIKKSYAGVIPWTEANRRYVVKLNLSPEAIGDETGKHLPLYDIRMGDFLAEQIAQRIGERFQEEGLKQYFKIEKSQGAFYNNSFIFEYSMEYLSQPEIKINIFQEILDIVTYCIKTYEFKDFSGLEIADLITEDRLILNQAEVLAGSIMQ